MTTTAGSLEHMFFGCMFSFESMRRAFWKAILSAAVVAACAWARGQSNVYSLAIYAGGTSYADFCLLDVPFPPYHYQLTQRSWYEDANGLGIMDLSHQNETDGTLRRLLDVECGSNSFSIWLEPAGGVKRPNAQRTISGTAGSGDLAVLMSDFVINRGGRPMATNATAAAPLAWVVYSREAEDVIVVAGDHFMEVQKFLEQSYGASDGTIHSRSTIGNARSITYGPRQIGVMLNLTADSRETIISIVGKRKA